MSRSDTIIQEILQNLDEFPDMPLAALQVHRLLQDPNTTSTKLGRVISTDPGLTMKVLRLANSAQYGFSRKIATISEAVSILGDKELKQIIYTIISHGMLNRPASGYALEKGALWENAFTCGMAARFLAQRLNYADQELAFTGALLRDIGKVALANYLVGHMPDIEKWVDSHKQSFLDAEEAIIGINHTQVGVEIAHFWNFPESLVTVIGYHHHPSKLPTGTSSDILKLVSLVHVADVFTMMTGRGIGIDGLQYPLDSFALKQLGLSVNTAQTLEALYAETLELQDINLFKSTLLDMPASAREAQL